MRIILRQNTGDELMQFRQTQVCEYLITKSRNRKNWITPSKSATWETKENVGKTLQDIQADSRIPLR